MQDQYEITGLIDHKKLTWVKCVKHLLIFDSVAFCQHTARDFRALADAAKVEKNTQTFIEMSIIAEQLSYWVENGHGVTSLIPFLGLRQLIHPYRVECEDLEIYTERILVLSRQVQAPKAPDFVLMADGEPATLHVAEKNSLLAEFSGPIASKVIEQDELNALCEMIMR